jgi:hypothetical protein
MCERALARARGAPARELACMHVCARVRPPSPATSLALPSQRQTHRAGPGRATHRLPAREVLRPDPLHRRAPGIRLCLRRRPVGAAGEERGASELGHEVLEHALRKDLSDRNVPAVGGGGVSVASCALEHIVWRES